MVARSSALTARSSSSALHRSVRSSFHHDGDGADNRFFTENHLRCAVRTIRRTGPRTNVRSLVILSSHCAGKAQVQKAFRNQYCLAGVSLFVSRSAEAMDLLCKNRLPDER
jgi:hypothetical protein